MTASLVRLINGLVCHKGCTKPVHLTFSTVTGLIVDNNTDVSAEHEVDLKGRFIAPGFIEVQTNGLLGFHFTHYNDAADYATKLDRIARHLPSQGVTGFYPTVPTVSTADFQRVSSSINVMSFDRSSYERSCRA